MYDLVKTVLAIVGLFTVFKKLNRKVVVKHTKRCECAKCLKKAMKRDTRRQSAPRQAARA